VAEKLHLVGGADNEHDYDGIAWVMKDNYKKFTGQPNHWWGMARLSSQRDPKMRRLR
jgi:hypothetical protein